MVQWLRLHTANEGGTDSIPGQEAKIPQAIQPKVKKRKSTRDNLGGGRLGSKLILEGLSP